uniref:Tetratricopeptide repeat protein n=1 Tax=candidate division WOR-3 bacterium TaxID=2052148 RepID=A0A7C4XKC6_UNCW3
MFKKALLIFLLLLLIGNLSYRIDLKKTHHELIGELMYFPSGFAVRALSLGFYVPLADMVWLRFIQYYGEHRMTDARFDLMYHILDILTTLDPYFVHAYTLGALMLTHDAQRPDQARNLLKKGMYHDIDEWRIPFIYGFIHYVFLREYKVAQVYFRISSQKPNAPDMPKRWAAFLLYKKIGDLRTSLALWIDLYNNAKNPEERSIAEIYIKEIKMELDIEFLNKKIEEFKAKIGRKPISLKELIVYNLIDSIPTEPHGERYYLRAGKAVSSWKKKK